MSSVVAPGLTALPPSCSAWAAIRPATRMASTTSSGCTHGSVFRAGAGLSTYSGRGMDDGTGRRGDWTPGFNGARTGMRPTLRQARQEPGRGRHRLARLLRTGQQHRERQVALVPDEPAVRVRPVAVLRGAGLAPQLRE